MVTAIDVHCTLMMSVEWAQRQDTEDIQKDYEREDEEDEGAK